MDQGPVRKALVVGLGISGISAALALHRAGWQVLVLERSRERRQGGHVIAASRTGLNAARRLGFTVPDRDAEYLNSYEIQRNGNRRRTLSYGESFPGTTHVVVRGDIEDAAFQQLPDAVEVRFASTVTAIEQDDSKVSVAIASGNETSREQFELVVGADGVRSTVRRLAISDSPGDLIDLGFIVAGCSLSGPAPGFSLHDGVVLAEPARSAWVFPFVDRLPTMLLNYRTDDPDAEFVGPPIERLRAVFGPEAPGEVLGWMLDEFERAPDPLFDRVQQVRINQWHRGRVVVLGDAAWAPTFYSGMGASTGIAGADLLGSKLVRHDHDVPAALKAWEAKLRPFIGFHQNAAIESRKAFVSADRVEDRNWRLLGAALGVRPLRAIFGKYFRNTRTARQTTVDIAAV